MLFAAGRYNRCLCHLQLMKLLYMCAHTCCISSSHQRHFPRRKTQQVNTLSAKAFSQHPEDSSSWCSVVLLLQRRRVVSAYVTYTVTFSPPND